MLATSEGSSYGEIGSPHTQNESAIPNFHNSLPSACLTSLSDSESIFTNIATKKPIHSDYNGDRSLTTEAK